MRILVTGARRGGTCLTRGMVDGLNIVKWCLPKKEDKKFFEYEKLPENYGTKLNAENRGYNLSSLTEMMEKYDDLHIIFSFRNPIDQCMSMIVRGQKTSEGGDGDDILAPDGVIEGAISAVKYCQSIYKEIVRLFPKRIYKIQLEDLILYPDISVINIAHFLGVEEFPPDEAFEFYKYNTNWRQRKRYRNKLDKSQVGIYKRWDTAYGGFFKNRKADIDKMQEAFNG